MFAMEYLLSVIKQCFFFIIFYDLINSLAPGKFEWNFRYVIFKQILVIDGWDISYEIVLIWMLLDFTDNQLTLVQVMAAVRQQAITWAKVDPDLCRHMVPLGHNVLKWNVVVFPQPICLTHRFGYFPNLASILTSEIRQVLCLQWSSWELVQRSQTISTIMVLNSDYVLNSKGGKSMSRGSWCFEYISF